MNEEDKKVVSETVDYLRRTYLQLELPERIRRHAELVRPLDPRYAMQLEARARELELTR